MQQFAHFAEIHLRVSFRASRFGFATEYGSLAPVQGHQVKTALFSAAVAVDKANPALILRQGNNGDFGPRILVISDDFGGNGISRCGIDRH